MQRLIKTNTPTIPMHYSDTVGLNFDAHGAGTYQTILAAATFQGAFVNANGCNQFTLGVWVDDPLAGAGPYTSRISIFKVAPYFWTPAAAARNLGQFNIVNGPVYEQNLDGGRINEYTFGIYSNTTLDLLASSGAHYFSLAVEIENTSGADLDYALILYGQGLQNSFFTEQIFR